MLHYQHFAHFPAAGSLSSYMCLLCIQTRLKTLTLNEIASTLREIRESIEPQEPGLFSSPIWTQFLKGTSRVSCASLKYMLAWILVLSAKWSQNTLKNIMGCVILPLPSPSPTYIQHIILKSGLGHLSSITKSHLLWIPHSNVLKLYKYSIAMPITHGTTWKKKKAILKEVLREGFIASQLMPRLWREL